MGFGNDNYMDRLQTELIETKSERDELTAKLEKSENLSKNFLHKAVNANTDFQDAVDMIYILEKKIIRIASIAGNTDPAEACRLIIKECD